MSSMMTDSVVDKLQRVYEAKNDIKESLDEYAGGGVTDDMTTYSQLIDNYSEKNLYELRELLVDVLENTQDSAHLINSAGDLVREAKEIAELKADVDGQYDKLTAGNAQNLIGRGEATPEEFTFRPSGDISIQDGTARVKTLKGNSVVWNQLVKNGNFAKGFEDWFFSEPDSYNYEIQGDVLTIEKTREDFSRLKQLGDIIDGNKYYYSFYYYSNSLGYSNLVLGDCRIVNASINNLLKNKPINQWIRVCDIITGNKTISNSLDFFSIGGGNKQGHIIKLKEIKIINLTKMFGAGNEPTTVEEFEALYPDSYYEYNPGEIKSLTATGIKSVGFNAWDEEWEVGNISEYTGQETTDNKRVMSKNFIPCLENTKYYTTDPTGDRDIMLFFYDSSKRFLNHTSWTGNNTFITPHNAAFMRFHCGVSYGTTYNHDICINLSNTGYRDGEYQPYVDFTRELPIYKIKDSEGNLLFPDGLCSAGSVYDEITEKKAIKRVGKVDLGTLNYVWSDEFGGFTNQPDFDSKSFYQAICSKYPYKGRYVNVVDKSCGYIYENDIIIKDSSYTDAASLKESLQGVYLYYELATPIEVDLDPEVNMDYEVWDFGTEQMISEGFSTPIKAEIVYGFNAVDRIRENTLNIEDLMGKSEQYDSFIEDLYNNKIDRENDDYYPNMAVGVADNLAGIDIVDSEINFRRSGDGSITDGVARIDVIKGNSVVWNQLVNYENVILSKDNVSYDETTGIFSCSPTNQAYLLRAVAPTLGNVYLTKVALRSTQGAVVDVFKGSTGPEHITLTDKFTYYNIIYTANASNYLGIASRDSVNPFEIKDYNIINLTKMFGAGNEPTTVEEFEKRCPIGVDINAYNTGEVIHMNVQSVESQGINAWDEEWEVGAIATETGLNYNSTSSIRSKNYSACIPNMLYASNVNLYRGIIFYDQNKTFVKDLYPSAGISFTTPANAYFFKINSPGSYGSTYKNDICINISDINIDGKYFPYVKRIQKLDIIRKYFPQGMRSAGNVYDEILYNKNTQKWEKIVRIGEVDLGTLNWTLATWASLSNVFVANHMGMKRHTSAVYPNAICTKYTPIKVIISDKADFAYDDVIDVNSTYASENQLVIRDTSFTDAASLKASLSGVYLYYELANPIVVELDEEDQFNDLDYQVWNFGTEKAIIESQSTPLAADITYGFNAIGRIRENSLTIEDLLRRVEYLESQLTNLSGSVDE